MTRGIIVIGVMLLCFIAVIESNAAPMKIVPGGVIFTDGTTQTTSATGGSGRWSANGLNIYYNSGRVGIGTDSPDGTLHLKSGGEEPPRIIIESTSAVLNPNLRFVTNDAGHPDPWYIMKTCEYGDLLFLHSTSPVISVALTLEYGTGNIGIGRGYPGFEKLQEKLQVDKGNILVRGAENFSKAGEEALVYLGDTNNYIKAKHGSGVLIGTWVKGDAVIVEHTTGFVGIGKMDPSYMLEVAGNAAKSSGGTTWINSSDERLKDVTGEYEQGLDAILGLRPVRFFYKEGNPRGLPSDEENIGFVAQEVQDVFPEAISEGPDGYLDFNMHPVNVAVVNAIKELKAENEALRTENALLKKDIEKIKAILGI